MATKSFLIKHFFIVLFVAIFAGRNAAPSAAAPAEVAAKLVRFPAYTGSYINPFNQAMKPVVIDAIRRDGYKLCIKTTLEQYEAYCQTLRFIEESVLSKDFNDITIDDIKRINCLVSADEKNDFYLEKPGYSRYRTEFGYILLVDSPEDIPSVLSQDELPRWNSLRKKVAKEVSGGKRLFNDMVASGDISAEELAALKKVVARVNPDPVMIPELMDQYLSDLKDLFNRHEDPFVIAAFAHMRLVDIHPFCDAHGRTARLLMNIALMHCGIFPIVCIDFEEYTAYVKAAEEGVDKLVGFSEKYLKFANYLRQLDRNRCSYCNGPCGDLAFGSCGANGSWPTNLYKDSPLRGGYCSNRCRKAHLTSEVC